MLNFNACLVRHAQQPLPIFTVFNICHSFMLVWDVGTIDLVVVAKANPTGSESSCLGERPKKNMTRCRLHELITKYHNNNLHIVRNRFLEGSSLVVLVTLCTFISFYIVSCGWILCNVAILHSRARQVSGGQDLLVVNLMWLLLRKSYRKQNAMVTPIDSSCDIHRWFTFVTQ
jgi:hypothetical protein